MVHASDFIYGTYMHIHPHMYASQIYGIFVKCDSHICFIHVYDNSIKSRGCSWLCYVIYVHQYWICMPIQNEGIVTYIYNMIAIFAQRYVAII